MVVVGLNSAKSENRVARLWWRVNSVRRVGSARKSRVQGFVSLFEMLCRWLPMGLAVFLMRAVALEI